MNDEIHTNSESSEKIQRRESGERNLRPGINKSNPQMSKDIEKDKKENKKKKKTKNESQNKQDGHISQSKNQKQRGKR